ncbi:hypothetical protein JTE90_028489 [Oedothorax gibbosus]|uniref:Nanos-type domain-containing protein n=1 Tax=Oedothorax gibbosus TaxID=931172 RepID=A0AAV6VUS3_9ARAC|nr:hypothetical protein JTE90_028489 [Oedothorax gibbosus]
MSAFVPPFYHFPDQKDYIYRQWSNSNMYNPRPLHGYNYRGFVPNYFYNYGPGMPFGNHYPVMNQNFDGNPVMPSPLRFKRNPTLGGSKAQPPEIKSNNSGIETPISVGEKVIIEEASSGVPKNSIVKAFNEPPAQPSNNQPIAIAAIRNKNHWPPARRICNLCRQNGECRAFYLDHPIKDSMGRVVCPVLYKVVCPICNATGENAHTMFYCPLKRQSNIAGSAPEQRPLAIRLKNTSYDSCGRLKRFNKAKKF